MLEIVKLGGLDQVGHGSPIAIAALNLGTSATDPIIETTIALIHGMFRKIQMACAKAVYDHQLPKLETVALNQTKVEMRALDLKSEVVVIATKRLMILSGNL